ncbi:hypothetical protein ACVBEF_11480 [Glaciimonas sp. GG7]
MYAITVAAPTNYTSPLDISAPIYNPDAWDHFTNLRDGLKWVENSDPRIENQDPQKVVMNVVITDKGTHQQTLKASSHTKKMTWELSSVQNIVEPKSFLRDQVPHYTGRVITRRKAKAIIEQTDITRLGFDNKAINSIYTSKNDPQSNARTQMNQLNQIKLNEINARYKASNAEVMTKKALSDFVTESWLKIPAHKRNSVEEIIAEIDQDLWHDEVQYQERKKYSAKCAFLKNPPLSKYQPTKTFLTNEIREGFTLRHAKKLLHQIVTEIHENLPKTTETNTAWYRQNITTTQ